MAIAWSVAEYIANKIKARGIFATHYHELNELASLLPNVANFQAIPIYWSTLERNFQRLLLNLPNKKDAAMRDWCGAVLSVADDAFEQTANSLSGSAEELRATVEARMNYRKWRNITKESPNFKIYLPETKAKGGTQ